VTEFFIRHSLVVILLNTGGFEEQMARFIFHQIIDAIESLQSAGVANRDLKPDSIHFDENFTMKIINFGYSSKIGRRNGES
jgi:serine/threonine protein kinase